jgi:hypothetical protein
MRQTVFARLGLGILATSAGVLAGCSPYVGNCSWFEPVGDEAIRIVAQRQPIPNECRCIGCSAPGQFELKRSSYVVAIWNGDRWYPELALRARALDGKPLHIESPQIRSLDQALVRDGLWREFDYFFDFPISSPPTSPGMQDPLVISIVTPTGEPLGTETIQLDLHQRRDWSIEWI